MEIRELVTFFSNISKFKKQILLRSYTSRTQISLYEALCSLMCYLMGVTICKKIHKRLGLIVVYHTRLCKMCHVSQGGHTVWIFQPWLLYLREILEVLWVTTCRRGKGRPGLHELLVHRTKITTGKKNLSHIQPILRNKLNKYNVVPSEH